MPLTHWLAFVITAIVVILFPGPTVLTVIGYSATHGRRATLPLVAAVGLGDTIAASFSLLGLGALLQASAFWFTVLKLCGGLYLIYLGVKSLRAGLTKAEVVRPKQLSGSRLFTNTVLVTSLNPKTITFFVAFLPQFVYGKNHVIEQLWLMAATFVVLATLNAANYATFAATVGRWLTTPRAQRGFHLTGGSILTAAGTWALLAKRHA
ncbi:MAG TPA: LysE family translocator [Steroidobacteraceae bacterium]